MKDFLKTCAEINYYTDYVKHNLFVDDKITEEEANKQMVSFMEKFMKSEKTIDMKALTEEEKLIVDTAGDNVADLLEAMEKVIE